ncbi:MAG: ABC transporter permease [Corynebacterium sp.]|uniref:ABC transporter permease n=1 Tax=Corynebacterium sp. TaxID=1720 RepID=UPI0026DCA6F8|nr:ABC transporter permease [Corynebacterium sp.]MDO5030866.1 ABC transporter permease [Corynebacterium sp.]
MAVPIVIAVTAAVFALAAVSPFDPLDAYLKGQAGNLTDAQRESISNQLGFNRSWWESWLVWLQGLAVGDLGISRSYAQPVTQVLAERLPWTMLLGACGLGGAIVLSFGLGLWAAVNRGGVADRAILALSTVIQATPPFVVALGGLGVFALAWQLFPTGGLTYPGRPVTFSSTVAHLVLPAVVLAVTQMPWLVLSLRESIVEVMDSGAVTGAQVRGIPRRRIIRSHLLPTAVPPFLALIGARLSELVVGSTLVEAVFAWPGLGTALVKSAQSLGFPLLSILTIATTVIVLFGNLLADVAFVVLDPRVDADV